jgi:hypothetical protein
VPSKPVRVLVLLTLLGVTAAFAAGTRAARRARTTWERPVEVAVFVLGDPPAAGLGALAATLDALAALGPAGPAAQPAGSFTWATKPRTSAAGSE